ncbi:hypothetical protein KAW65_06810 [candidate division WOR-3 bacterium]|nr:hypothetical protein [candidate division WOR-3 bacterium]
MNLSFVSLVLLFLQFQPPQFDSLHKNIKFTNEKRLKVWVELENFKFKLKKGNTLIETRMKYNSKTLSPVFKYEKKGRVGEVIIKEKREKSKELFGSRNECDLELTSKIPLDLDLSFSSSFVNIDCSGLKIEGLQLSVPAGKTLLCFNSPNSVNCKDLNIFAGLSSFNGKYLGNACFEKFYFKGTAGFYTLDFRGEFTGKKRVEITMGVGKLKLILPKDTGIRLKLTGANLKFIRGLKLDNEGWWLSSNLRTAKRELIIHIDTSFGILEVEIL